MKTQYLYQVVILLVLFTLYIKQVQTIATNERIISGSQAAVNQFPWHVLLKRDEFDVLLCGGSLISNSWVLSAAHCFNNITSVFLVFGTIDLYNDDINMTSTAIFKHPHFDAETFHHDISLIQLPQALNFSNSIQAIELITCAQAEHDFIGTPAIITGFGQLDDEDDGLPDILQWAPVEIVNTSSCAEVFGDDLAMDTHICTSGYTSICDGDSGGALVWLNDYDSFVQIGINSFVAVNRCEQNFPAVYVRLYYYMGFIQNITGINFEEPTEIF
ncbi:chymotrypsin BI-like [Calliphora vicina]|uniref:chymotrypsin BI-like n=1 Tax=Calliphora vicina TaxID=7373 RepID=UPI00325B1C7B